MAILKNYVAPKAVNPFASVVDELIDAGEGAAFEHIAHTERTEGVTGTAATDRKRFQDAARDSGYSARIVENDEREDGTTRLVFILTAKRTRTVKPVEDTPEGEGKGKSGK